LTNKNVFDLFFAFYYIGPLVYHCSKKSNQRSRARTAPVSRPLFLSPPFIDASLVEGSFKKIVVLPKYVDEDEWLAVNGK